MARFGMLHAAELDKLSPELNAYIAKTISITVGYGNCVHEIITHPTTVRAPHGRRCIFY